MAAFAVCALVFVAWIVVQIRGWPKNFRLSFESDSNDGDVASHGHAGDDGGGGDGGGD